MWEALYCGAVTTQMIILNGGSSSGKSGTLAVLWVGVRCESAVAAGREVARGDRIQGMTASQADVVHEGVFYDLEVDTTHTESLVCWLGARTIAAHVS